MSNGFEDLPPSGEGMPLVEQTKATRDYLLRHNRPSGIKSVLAELRANGFTLAFASVQRHLKEPGNRVKKAVSHERLRGMRSVAKARAEPIKMTPEQEAASRKAIVEAIIGTQGNFKSNSEIALHENKIRMALNIMLMEMLMEKPERILLDPRGFAAFIDAMTVSSKVSGGASFEVLPPGVKPDKDGSAMRDVTPPPVEKSATQISIADFRRKQTK